MQVQVQGRTACVCAFELTFSRARGSRDEDVWSLSRFWVGVNVAHLASVVHTDENI